MENNKAIDKGLTTPSPANEETVPAIKSSISQKEINEKDWYIFTKSFLKLAKMGCDKILGKKDELVEEDKIAIIAIIFNLKHGIEIFLKMLIHRFQDEDNLGSKFQSHKNSVLVEALDLKRNKEFKKFLKNNDKARSGFIYIKKIIKKYNLSDLPFLHFLHGRVCLEDNGNNFFKYPQFKYEDKRDGFIVSVDHSKIVKEINSGFIGGVNVDINSLLNVFNKIKDDFDKEIEDKTI